METTARQAALAALERCRRDGAWSGASIDNVIKKYSLDRRDAALASRLCLGVLQNSRFCDFYIDLYRAKGGAGLEPKLRDILRLGVYQLLFLDKIPARAAVSESVALSRAAGFGRASGLVNAVLRKVSDNIGSLPDIPGKGSAEYLSVKYSHPLWLVKRIISEHDYSFAEAFFAANNSPPGLTIQVNKLKVSPDAYRRALIRAEIPFTDTGLSGCLRIERGVVAALPGFEEGLFYVQDKAARTAVEIAAPRAGMKVLDACAAPGGKSFAAAIAMVNKGEILSCDIHEKKLSLIRSGAKRLGIDIIETMARDARQPDSSREGAFDLVIADVPCSGLGVIGKKPEIRNKKESEISALPQIQRQILDNLSTFVKPGGLLLYSTCTVLPSENEEVAEGFLRDNPGFEPVGFSLGGICAEQGMYTFWPHLDGTDGFFIAEMKRKC